VSTSSPNNPIPFNIMPLNSILSAQYSIFGNFVTQQIALLLGLWVLIIFGFRISGSHYNPAISIAFMARKDVGHFPRSLGIAYIIF